MEWNPQVTPHQVALVCHPHPVYGGTMHNKVVFRAAKAALISGLPTLRFNFRGAGHSVGTFAGGVGEQGDVRAALDYLAAHFPGLPVCSIGFSSLPRLKPASPSPVFERSPVCTTKSGTMRNQRMPS